MDDPNGRYHVVPVATLAPGVDWVTRSPEGPFIDTGVEVAFAEHGRLYLSVETVRQLADVAGLLDGLVIDGMEIEAAREEGYERALKESIVEHLGSYISELGGILAAASGDSDPAGELALEEPVEEPPVGEPAPAGQSAPEPAPADQQPPADPEPAPVPVGQAKRAPRKPRAVSVPSDSGDDNPFQ